MNEDDFYLKVAHALSGCQLVEQQLKLYITRALELVTICIDGKIPFKMKGEDYANHSLERLIQTFRLLSDNEELVKRLNKFKDERNFLSHKGITHCLDYEHNLSDSIAKDVDARLLEIQRVAKELYIEIHNDANKFMHHVWFNGISENG